MSTITTRPYGQRHIDVLVDGEMLGSVELDGSRFLAKPAGLPCEWFGAMDAAVAHIAEHVARDRAAWQRALARAIADGLDPIEVAGKQYTYFVESGSKPGVGYLCSTTSCTCPAAAGRHCKHRAAVRAALGMIALDAAPVACHICNGTGRVMGDDARDGAVACRCLVCGGAGSLTADQAATIAGWAA